MPSVQLNDEGTTIVLAVDEDGADLNVTGATAITFYFKKPDSTTASKTGAIHDASTGKFRYITETGFLDVVGRWEVQVGFTLTSWIGRSSVGWFTVNANL